MATRMQQRRGTAAQWISTNGGDGPILNAGEIGYETDTNKFKVGDGINHWVDLNYFLDAVALGGSIDDYIPLTDKGAVNGVAALDANKNVVVPGASIIVEGTTDNTNETTITVTDPTADRTITFPDQTGTVQLRVTDVSDTEISYLNGVTSAIQTQLDDKSTASKTETLTNKSISLGSNTVTSTLAQLNTAVSDADVASLAGTETLSNKTLTTPTINGPTITAVGQTPTIHGIYLPDSHNIIFEGYTANDFETTLQVADPTADRVITLPDATGTVAILDATQTFTNKTLTSPKINEDVAVTATATELNYVDGVTSAIQTQMDAKAPLASPAFTGTVALTSTVNGPNATTSVNLLSTSTSANITLGALQTSGNLTIGGGTQRTTGIVGIGTGATTTGTKTIDIGTGSTGGTTAITVGSSSGATSNITLNGTVTAANNLVVTGDLTVNGTTTTINSTTLAVDDKNIVIGDVAIPSDTTADGGGITLKGATDKTFNWVDATDAWTSSEDLNLLTGKSYEINGTVVLSSTQVLGKAVPSGTIVGTSDTQTLTDKTLTSPTITTPTLSLSATSNTGAGRISFDSTADKLYVGDGTTAIEFAGSTVITNAQTASYTTVLTDKDKLIEMNVGSANNLTIPLNSSVAYPIGTVLNIVQIGTGQTTVVATGGVTINATPGLKLRAQYSSASCIKRAENTWILLGDLTA